MATFELTDDIIGDIAFCMEDSSNEYAFDLVSLKCVRLDDDELVDEGDGTALGPGRERQVSLPPWSSRDGYELMLKFAQSRKPSAIRDSLMAALDRKHGVFGAFKDALAAYPDIKNEFSGFRTAALGREIRLWHEEIAESDGGRESGDRGVPDVMYEDFSVSVQGASSCLDLLGRTVDSAVPAFREAYRETLKGELVLFCEGGGERLAYCAETPSGEGIACAAVLFSGKAAVVRWVGSLDGRMGVSLETMLLERISRDAKERGCRSVTVAEAPPGISPAFREKSVSEGFVIHHAGSSEME